MNYQEYIRNRERRSEEFRRQRESQSPLVQFQIALIEARLRADLTQAELAEHLGVPQSSISRWENGLNMPTVETLTKLARVLGVQFHIDEDSIRIEEPGELATA